MLDGLEITIFSGMDQNTALSAARGVMAAGFRDFLSHDKQLFPQLAAVVLKAEMRCQPC